MKNPERLFAVFLGIGIAAGQTPPPDQTRQIELQKEKERECLRQSAERSRTVLIGFPTLSPLHPIIIMQPPLKKMELK